MKHQAGSQTFVSAAFQLAMVLQTMGLHVSPHLWTINQDDSGVTVHFQWTPRSYWNKQQQGNKRQQPQPANDNHSLDKRLGQGKKKSPSTQRRDRERWNRRKAQHTGRIAEAVKSTTPGKANQLEVSPSAQVNCVNAVQNQPLRAEAPVFQMSPTVTEPGNQSSTHGQPVDGSTAEAATPETLSPQRIESRPVDIINSNHDTKPSISNFPFVLSTEIDCDIFDLMDVVKTDLKQTKAKLQKVSNNLTKKERDNRVKDKSIEEQRTKISDLENKLKLVSQDNDQCKQEIQGYHVAMAECCNENKRLARACYQNQNELGSLRVQYDRISLEKRNLQSKYDKMSKHWR